MKNKTFLWAFTVSISGLLFGFDTAVISGADQPIQSLWGLSDLHHGFFIMSMALWGTVIGSLFGGIPCDRFGRKKTLIWIGVLYLVSALGSALAPEFISFSIFRFIGGLGVGASSVAAPIYISEIAPSERRGRLVILYQVNLVFGILLAYVSNYFLGFIGEGSWRWMLGVEAIPAAIYLFMILSNPESPRWLVLFKKDDVAAKKVLAEIYPPEELDTVIQQIHSSDEHHKGKRSIFNKDFRRPVMLAFLMAFFNQLSGINFVIYYAPRIFNAAGFSESTALLSTAGIGLVNLLVTALLGMTLIDRVGRRLLMIIGSIGYATSLGMLAYTFFIKDFDGISVPLFIFAFIASHAIGQGSVIWVFISEVFPNSVRANGQALGTGTHWVFAALITVAMPYVLNRFDGGPIFAFFSFMMILQLLFALFIMPETKGSSLEELDQQISK